MGSMSALTTAIPNPRNQAASCPKGARALGKQQTLPQAGTRAPESLPARIHAAMPHPAPQGREPSGGNRHYLKPEPGRPDKCYHGSRQLCRIPPQGARALGNCRMLPYSPNLILFLQKDNKIQNYYYHKIKLPATTPP